MAIFLSNAEIQVLILEEKRIEGKALNFSSMKKKKGHKESDVLIARSDGSNFKIILRQNSNDPLDFSAILAFSPQGSNEDFKLKRYNGKNHQHTNRLHKNKFYDFHIHTATEEYQRAGMKEEMFAEQTQRYSTLTEAFTCLTQDCNVILPEDKQLKLF
jgi:hypothetical protein